MLNSLSSDGLTISSKESRHSWSSEDEELLSMSLLLSSSTTMDMFWHSQNSFKSGSRDSKATPVSGNLDAVIDRTTAFGQCFVFLIGTLLTLLLNLSLFIGLFQVLHICSCSFCSLGIGSAQLYWMAVRWWVQSEIGHITLHDGLSSLAKLYKMLPFYSYN